MNKMFFVFLFLCLVSSKTQARQQQTDLTLYTEYKSDNESSVITSDCVSALPNDKINSAVCLSLLFDLTKDTLKKWENCREDEECDQSNIYIDYALELNSHKDCEGFLGKEFTILEQLQDNMFSLATEDTLIENMSIITKPGDTKLYEFYKTIEDGKVPSRRIFVKSQYFRQSDSIYSNEEICSEPGLATKCSYLMAGSSIYVLLDTNSKVEIPNQNLNLSIVLDVSPSMLSEDNRLQWLKDAVKDLINGDVLKNNDILSICAQHGNTTDIILSPIAFSKVKKNNLLTKIDEIEAKEVFHFDNALEKGVSLVKKNYNANNKNVVLLITDAGVADINITNPKLTQLVTDHFEYSDIDIAVISMINELNSVFIDEVDPLINHAYARNEEMLQKHLTTNLKQLIYNPIHSIKHQLRFDNNWKFVKIHMPPSISSTHLNPLMIKTLKTNEFGGDPIILEFAETITP